MTVPPSLLAVVLALTSLYTARAFHVNPLVANTYKHAGAAFSSGFASDGKNPARPATALHSSLAVTTALSALDTFWQTSPYTAAALICGTKASAADMIAQKRDLRKREEKKREQEAVVAAANSTAAVVYNPDLSTTTTEKSKKTTDWKRNIAFVMYGSLYQGCAQEFIYNHLYPVWFGSATSVTVVLTKVLFDLLIQTTTVTLPIAYLTKSLIYRYSFKEAMRRYVDDIKNHGLLKKYFLLWGPVQCITFGIVPEHYRVTFVAFVSFFWLIILSTIASKTPSPGDQATADALAAECKLEDGLTCNIDG